MVTPINTALVLTPSPQTSEPSPVGQAVAAQCFSPAVAARYLSNRENILAIHSQLHQRITGPLTGTDSKRITSASQRYTAIRSRLPPVASHTDNVVRTALQAAYKALATALLHVACLQCNFEQVRMLLQTTEATITPSSLLYASTRGVSALVNLIVGHTDTHGTTLLHRECDENGDGKLDVVATLLQCGARIDARDGPGYTPLYLAAANGRLDLVRFLLAHGADLNASCGPNAITPLYAASRGGHEAIVKALLDAGATTNPPVPGGVTGLHTAAEHGHLTVVRLLLERGADPNTIWSQTGYTPFHYASMYGHPAVASALLDGGAAIDMPAANGATALCFAAGRGHHDIVRLLSERGARHDNASGPSAIPLLHIAAKRGHTTVVQALLDLGAAIDATASDGSTALHRAAHLGHLDTVRLLVERGASIEARDEDDVTPLYLAAIEGRLDAVRLLLDLGAAIDATANDSGTALHAATTHGHLDTMRLLVERGASIEARDGDDFTPLYLAAMHGHLDTVRLLLTLRADPNASCGPDALTPLYTASTEGHDAIVRALLDAGATTNPPVQNGVAALHAAAEHGHLAIVQLLLERRADHNAAWSPSGHTPLHLASMSGHPAVADALLNAGAAIDMPNADGHTALFLAAKNNCLDIVRLLIDRGAKTRDKNDYTLLFHSAIKGRLGVVQLLLTLGADPNASCGPDALTPLYGASLEGHDAIVKVLLDAGATTAPPVPNGVSALHTAAEEGHLAIVHLLLGRGADPNAVWSPSGRTPLQLASIPGRRAVIEALLKAGAAIDARDADDATALFLATTNGHPDVVRLLIEQGARHDAVWGPYALHLLHIAAQHGHAPVVQALLDLGAPIEAATSDGNTPLHAATLHGHLDVVRLLIKQGARHDVVWGPKAIPLLYIAAQYGHAPVVQEFLDMGAAIEATISNGWNALHAAAQYGRLAVVRLLLERGAKCDVTIASSAITPLHFACENGHDAIAGALLDAGANIEARNTRGCTPLYFATENNQLKVMSLLLARGAAVDSANSTDMATPLHLAVNKGFCDATALLLERGANPENPFSPVIATPLHLASERGHCNIARLLIERGVNRNALNTYGRTAYGMACAFQRVEVAQLLASYDSLLSAEFRQRCSSYALHPEHLASAQRWTALPELVPDAPVSDLLTFDGIPDEQRPLLQKIITRIANRTPDIGTPKEGSEALEAFYVNIERYLTNTIAALKRSNDTAQITKALADIADVSNLCGGALMEASRGAYRNVVLGLAPTCENSVAFLLAEQRERLLRACVRDPDDEHNVHQYQRLLHALGKEFAVPGADASYEDIHRHNSIEEARTRMRARYTALGIIDDCLLPRLTDDATFREQFLDWCTKHIPADFEPNLPDDERPAAYLEQHVIVDMEAIPMRIQPEAVLSLLEQLQVCSPIADRLP